MLPLGLWGLCWMEGKEKQPDCWWRHANQWEKTGGDPSVCLSVSSSILRQVQRSADKQTQLPDITPICETQSKFWKNRLGIWKKERGKWKLPCPQGKAQGPSGKPSFPSLLSLIYLRKIKKNTDWNKKKITIQKIPLRFFVNALCLLENTVRKTKSGEYIQSWTHQGFNSFGFFYIV